MKVTKNYLNPIIGIVSSLLIFSFLSCGCSPNSSVHKNQPDRPKQKDKLKKLAIVLFHGFSDQGGLKNLEEKLKSDFSTTTVITLDVDKSLNTKGIEAQAQNIFEQMQKNKSLADKKLIFLGDSQGGLVAFSLYTQFKNQIQVKGLITNHTPWEGTKLASNTDSDIDQLLENNTLQHLDYVLPNYLNFQNSAGNQNILKNIIKSQLEKYTGTKSIEDLKPNSPFLQRIASELSNTSIPILAIGGYNILIADVLGKELGFKDSDIKFLNLTTKLDWDTVEEAWAKFIGASSNDHDFLIPSPSQIAEKLSKNSNFKDYVIDGYDHYQDLTDYPVYDAIKKEITHLAETE